jgi:hypothetical protein
MTTPAASPFSWRLPNIGKKSATDTPRRRSGQIDVNDPHRDARNGAKARAARHQGGVDPVGEQAEQAVGAGNTRCELIGRRRAGTGPDIQLAVLPQPLEACALQYTAGEDPVSRTHRCRTKRIHRRVPDLDSLGKSLTREGLPK